jgi:hypothetical protein
VHQKWNAAWYVGFDKRPRWHMAQTRAISPERVSRMLELTAQQ